MCIDFKSGHNVGFAFTNFCDIKGMLAMIVSLFVDAILMIRKQRRSARLARTLLLAPPTVTMACPGSRPSMRDCCLFVTSGNS